MICNTPSRKFSIGSQILMRRQKIEIKDGIKNPLILSHSILFDGLSAEPRQKLFRNSPTWVGRSPHPAIGGWRPRRLPFLRSTLVQCRFFYNYIFHSLNDERTLCHKFWDLVLETCNIAHCVLLIMHAAAIRRLAISADNIGAHCGQ